MSSTPLLALVRPSCAAAARASQIAISDEKIDAFLGGLDVARYNELKKEHGLVFPLRFGSFTEEITFVSTLSLLNALSGYRAEFHAATGHGAYDNVRHLLLGMYLANDKALSAASLRDVTPTQLASVLGVPTHTESAHPTLPFVTVGTVGGPLHAPLELVANACKAAGQFLEEEGKPDLGTYILDACTDALAHDDAESRLLESVRCVSHPDYLYSRL